MRSSVGFFWVFICCAFLLSASGLEEGTPGASAYYLSQEPPGDTAVLFAPGIVSTKVDESNFLVSPDGREIYFSRNYKMMVMKQRKDGSGWTEPQQASFSGQLIDSSEFALTPDGKQVYFNLRKHVTGSKVTLNLFVAERTNSGWSKPRGLGSPVSDQTMHAVSVSNSGTLYASGIIKMEFINGVYLPAKKLSPIIKGYHPFIAADESYIIFDAKGEMRSNPQDLYISFRKKDNTWTTPQNLGPKINTSKMEGNASVSPDGKYLFFTRNFDIYWVEATFIPELKSKS